MHTLNSIMGDWKNQIWRGQGDSFNFYPLLWLCSLNYSYLHIFWVCRQSGSKANLRFSLIQPSMGVWSWAGYQTASQTVAWVCLVGIPRRWQCANGSDVRLRGGCCKKGPEVHERFLGKGSPWFGRTEKDRHMAEEMFWLRLAGVVGNTGDMQGYFSY